MERMSLEELARLRRGIESHILEAIRRCRREGQTWLRIAEQLGVTQSEAHRRYAVLVAQLERRPGASRGGRPRKS